MQNVGGRDAACEIAINTDVIGIQDLRNVGDRRNREAPFIHAAVHGDMRVAIDNPRHDELPRAINHQRVFRRMHGLSDFRNLSVHEQNRAVLDGAVRNRQNRGVLDDDRRGRWGKHGVRRISSTRGNGEG